MSIITDYHVEVAQRITANSLKGVDITKDKQRMDLVNNDPLALLVFHLCNFIEDNNIWQCKKGKVVWMMQNDIPDAFGRRNWFSVEKTTLQNNYALLRDIVFHPSHKRPIDPFDEFCLILETLNRKFTDVVQKWGPAQSGELNILEANFCLANEFDDTHYHWFLDTVFKSITGGYPQDMEHLQRVLLRRWQAPDPFLPGQFINDEGASGKTLFAQTFVNTLFGGLVHTNASMDHITGKFNEEVAGKAVVYINEAVREKTDMDALKQFMGSPQVRVEAKFERPYMAENRALIICSGNSETGSVSLKGKGADRRFSIYSPTKTIYWWIVRDMKQQENKDITEGEAKIWLETAGQHILADPLQVGMWLSAMIQKYGDVGPVEALRNEAYDRMLAAQTPAWLDFVRDVFEHPKFVYISKGRLEEMIRTYCRGEMLPGPTIMKKRISEYCEKLGLATECRERVYIQTGWDVDIGEPQYTRLTVWINKDNKGKLVLDESIFGEYDHNGRWIFTWIH